MATDSRPGPTRWAKAFAAVVTFVIAVIGAVTGVIACARSTEVHVRVVQPPISGERTIYLGIVNSSQRGVSIVSGTLRFDGHTVGRVTSFVPGVVSSNPRREADRLAAASTPPLSLAGGQSFVGTVQWGLPQEGEAVA
jgi:hypothetical protein